MPPAVAATWDQQDHKVPLVQPVPLVLLEPWVRLDQLVRKVPPDSLVRRVSSFRHHLIRMLVTFLLVPMVRLVQRAQLVSSELRARPDQLVHLDQPARPDRKVQSATPVQQVLPEAQAWSDQPESKVLLVHKVRSVSPGRPA